MIILLCCLFTTDYFTLYKHGPITQDRASNHNIYSVAASGFALPVIAYQDKLRARKEIIEVINWYTVHNPPENRGWFYHFHDRNYNPVFNAEISTIDTAIFWRSALFAAEILNDNELKQTIQDKISKIDLTFVMRDGLVLHGFFRENQNYRFINCKWDEYNEGVILYELFDLPFSPQRIHYDMPIFVFAYPVALYPHNKTFKQQLDNAIKYHLDNYGYIVSAGDTEYGYTHFNRTYEHSLLAYGLGIKPLTNIHMKNKTWQSTDRVGIDEGAVSLLRRQYGK